MIDQKFRKCYKAATIYSFWNLMRLKHGLRFRSMRIRACPLGDVHAFNWARIHGKLGKELSNLLAWANRIDGRRFARFGARVYREPWRRVIAHLKRALRMDQPQTITRELVSLKPRSAPGPLISIYLDGL
jgi:hypothetical protein